MACDAASLVAAAVPIDGCSAAVLREIQTGVLNSGVSGLNLSAEALEEASSAFRKMSPREHLALDTFLIASSFGVSTVPATLLALAIDFDRLGHRMCEVVKTHEICTIANPAYTLAGALADARLFGGYSCTDHAAAQSYMWAVKAGGSTDPQVLINSARAFLGVDARDLLLMQLYALCSAASCVDVPADLVPTVTAHYTSGAASSLDIAFPKACCNPGGYWIYGASNDAQLQQGIIPGGSAGQPYTVLGVDVTGIADATGYYVKQYCADLSLSGASNTVTYAEPNCGTATSVIVVSGAGDPDANGNYVFDQVESDLNGFPVYTNPVSGYLIEFSPFGTYDARLYDPGLIPQYRLETGECFPCGTWSKTGLEFGPLPLPTAAWGSEGLEEAELWANRVVTNGGVRPSLNTVNAAGTFLDALDTAGIKTKLKAVNIFAPDNLTAAITPLIKTVGSDPWTNSNFVLADLSVNGLKGDGVNKRLSTGWSPSGNELGAFDMGLSVYAYDVNLNVLAPDFMGVLANDTVNALRLSRYDDKKFFDSGNYTVDRVEVVQNDNRNGFYSGSSTSSTARALYFANTNIAFSQLGTDTSLSGDIRAQLSGPVSVFCYRQPNGVIGPYSQDTLSFAAIHTGLDQTETEALYNAVQALRVALGGGYEPSRANAATIASNWSSRVVTNGGAAPSAGTITAATTFWQALITAGIHLKMHEVNIVAPDNLIAAITPLWRTAGNDPWTNNNLVAGDLSVNGLQGNGSNKWLHTGFLASRLGIYSSGLTVYATNRISAGSSDGYIGAYADANTTTLRLSLYNNQQYWDHPDGTGTRVLTAGNINAAAYRSGNRIAVNASNVYNANSLNAHASAGSNTNACGKARTQHFFYAMASNAAGSMAEPANMLFSFFAIHDGLTATESLAFYNAVQALRTALGGGYV